MRTNNTLLSITICLLGSSYALAGNMGQVGEGAQGLRPVVSIFGGVASVNVNRSQHYVGDDDNVFAYQRAGGSKTTGLVGVFLGGEHALPRPGLLTQVGVEYTSLGHVGLSGTNTVGIQPDTSTLYNYHYRFQTQQVLAVAKWLATTHQKYHPYVSAGIGAAFNHSSQFSAVTMDTNSPNLTAGFDNKTQTSFSYSVGAGLDTNLSEHVRVAFGYRFTGLGKASFGDGRVSVNEYSSPTLFSLHTPNAYLNQFVAQISYVI